MTYGSCKNTSWHKRSMGHGVWFTVEDIRFTGYGGICYRGWQTNLGLREIFMRGVLEQSAGACMRVYHNRVPLIKFYIVTKSKWQFLSHWYTNNVIKWHFLSHKKSVSLHCQNVSPCFITSFFYFKSWHVSCNIVFMARCFCNLASGGISHYRATCHNDRNFGCGEGTSNTH
jgi:hypothetical protein